LFDGLLVQLRAREIERKIRNKENTVERNKSVQKVFFCTSRIFYTYDTADELEESDFDIGVGMVAVDLLIVAVEAADRADLAADTTLKLVPRRNEINSNRRKLRGCMTE
jgi:DUF1009 family protein